MTHKKFREELSFNLIKGDQKVEKSLEKADKRGRWYLCKIAGKKGGKNRKKMPKL